MQDATISTHLIQQIVTAEHHDPFSILGMHTAADAGEQSLVIRTFQPEAQQVVVVADNYPEQRTVMQRVHQEGFFETVYAGVEDLFPYRFEVTYQNSHIAMVHDPYSFPPLLSDYDMYLFAEGSNHKIYEKLGSHKITLNGVQGFAFAVWAPNARRVSVVGDFNRWDGRRHQMRCRGGSGIWELFVPELKEAELYKYEIKSQEGHIIIKSDPYAFYTELRPKTASITWCIDKYKWNDARWMRKRASNNQLEKPISIYEVHLGSWMKIYEESIRSLTYREIAPRLISYVKEMGYTHVEFLPLASHPYDPSWGYQVAGYYSPTARYGTPEDLMYLIDQCHQHDIGVILDWVPAHFPSDAHALACFDGTCLYEHADPKKGSHPDWGTLVFNYGRNEVVNFLISNALFWLTNYHIDGLRVDAVASMLYLDYSRKEGEWIPNKHGGRENLEAIGFLKKLNELVHGYFPGALMIAEESTAWPAVSRPTYLGGLGFGLKWNMGWMHDILVYMSKDPIHRKHHHNMLTFALLYTFYENFILSFSHDEVVHGKGSMLGKMPGDVWQKFANMRLLLSYMFGHPGKKHLFMGIDIGQWSEWNHNTSIEWHLLQHEPHHKLQNFVKTLNWLYRSEPALFELDFEHTGFEWIDFTDADNCIISFIRKAKDPDNMILFVYNFTPVPRENYRLGLPSEGFYHEILNSDSHTFGGTNRGNCGGKYSEPVPWQGKPCSVKLTLPPLSCLAFKPEKL